MKIVNWLKTTLLLTSITLLFVLVGRVFAGTGGMLVALGIAALLNVGIYWFSDRIALAMSGAREVTAREAPELHRVVAQLARQADIPKPRLYVIESATPNAFATGRNPAHAAVAVTTGIMRLLSTDELAGVVAHELAHIRNRDTLLSAITATFAGAITTLADLAQWTLFFGGVAHNDDGEETNGLSDLVGTLVMIVVAPLAALLIQLAISRTREYDADATGARILGDPIPLAEALEKLDSANRVRPMAVNPALAHQFVVHPFAGGVLASLFSTHPPVAERIARLRALARTSKTRWLPVWA